MGVARKPGLLLHYLERRDSAVRARPRARKGLTDASRVKSRDEGNNEHQDGKSVELYVHCSLL